MRFNITKIIYTALYLVSILLSACGRDVNGGPGVTTPKAWGTAELIESDNAGDAYSPQIAIDASGNALVVWNQYDGTFLNIWANRYTSSTHSWGTATLIETGSGDAWYPQVAINASGNALAVWQQYDGTRDNIVANHYTAGSVWGSAAMIATDNSGYAYTPQIAIDASGNALAVWMQLGPSQQNIWANRYTTSTGWGTAELIETDLGGASVPQIAIDANGNALAVWSQGGATINIWANRYTSGSGWGTAELIETNNAGSALAPQIAIDASGNALAVWKQYDGTFLNIWANRYTAGSGWGTAELIETDNAGDANTPQIAFDASGNALAVWQQSDGTRFSIWANNYTTGSGWGTATLIENDNAGDANTPQIAFDANGNALAVWYQYDGTRFNIWVNHYTTGSGWGTAALIENDNAGDAYFPQIAIDASGNALALWHQYDGTRNNIWANRFQ